MKKRMKKLSLSRETVRHLNADHFRRVVGGGQTYELMTGCACTDGCGGGGTGGCGSGGCGSGGCGSAGCTSNTYEILSGCATNCG